MRIDRKTMLLYGVTDSQGMGVESLYDRVEKALSGGVTILQLREKNLPFDEFLREATEIKKLCRKYNVPLIINDNVEIAKKSDADGVHLGQDDEGVEYARRVLGDKIIGVSAHNLEEAKKALEDGADYLGSGAVFGTNTKHDVTGLPIERLREICKSVDIPVVAIGGITKDNIMELRNTGISGVAVVSAIFGADDVKRETENLKELAEKIAE